ncbi:hypothetical protein [Mucilaginibacter segetis]|uniref:Uncharacterized protein n=1 Tax=Mucilaginibacter segetis TaxID=2793071 RepID=A0A934PUE8_9SPHI|nr:hypothetical protein [Mucilaginibacter segetis]MBK0379331.1 hypothetical protein [Mucilaginibacter segetis]
MFVFYHLDDLILLHRLQVLSRIAATGVNVLIPALKEADYSPVYWQQLREIAARGIITIKEQEIPMDFILEHQVVHRRAGRSLLMLLHFCLSEHAILVANEDDVFVRALCTALKVPVYSLEDFNIATINNKMYFEFMAELKKEQAARLN